jgi:RNA polymerase sigma-70 factor, ECF subfamily
MASSLPNLPLARTNEEWIEQLSSGDALAIQELRDFLKRGLLAGLRRKIGDEHAEDFAQEGVLKVLSGLTSYRGDSLFTTWALVIGMRVAFSELRRARWKDISLDQLTEKHSFSEPPVKDESPGAAMDLADLYQCLRRLIDSVLSERQRSLIQAELDGVPQAVICDRLGTNRNALYKLGHDARLKLKSALLANGISEDDVRTLLAAASNH